MVLKAPDDKIALGDWEIMIGMMAYFWNPAWMCFPGPREGGQTPRLPSQLTQSSSALLVVYTEVRYRVHLNEAPLLFIASLPSSVRCFTAF